MTNRLYYGDCLTIMADMPQASVDLIYLDPPFNSKQEYGGIYKDETGRPLPDQIEAFCDMWTLNAETERTIRHMPVLMREYGIDDQTAEFWRLWLNALRDTQPRLLAYLSYMVQRLLQMRLILKPTASLYLHCDPTASHYIKVMLDGIFGHANFQNELTWHRSGGKSDAKRYGRVSDRLLFYTKSSRFTWNRQYQAHDPAYVQRTYRYDDRDGRGAYATMPLHAAGLRNGESGQPWGDYDPGHNGNHWRTPTQGIMAAYIVNTV